MIEDFDFEVAMAGLLSGGGQSAVMFGSSMKRSHSSTSGELFVDKVTYGFLGAMMG